jgi:hypothetical protein
LAESVANVFCLTEDNSSEPQVQRSNVNVGDYIDWRSTHWQFRWSGPKKQGATGITTVAPYVAGQWGRGNNRLPV